MATQRFTYSDMIGFSPSVDPTNSDKIFALTGRNYVFDSSGPRSIFGDRFLTPVPWIRPQNIEGIRIHFPDGDVTFTFNGDGIWEWDEALGGWKCLYQTENTNLQRNRWTWGYLNGYIYACHPTTGILAYSVTDRIIQPAVDIGIGIPTDALALTVNNGMLAVLGTTYLYWSNPSNGLDFTPALGGAGFQNVKERVSGECISMTSYATAILTWTTGGCMRSEFTGDEAVYRHRALNTDVRPVNSYCVANISSESSIILDERGLFLTQGGIPAPYSVMFNEFLIGWIRKNGLKAGTRLRIEWDELQKHLYVSASLADSTAGFDECWVYYPNTDKWGQFSEFHYGIFPIRINNSARAGDYYAYCDRTGRVRIWVETPTIEALPDKTHYVHENMYYPPIEYPIQPDPLEDKILAGSTVCAMSWNSNSQVEGSVKSGFYYEGFNVPALTQVNGLNAEIQFGLFRPTGPSAIDECCETVGVTIRSHASSPTDLLVTDWTTATSVDFSSQMSQDFNNVTGTPDIVGHKVSLIGTLDGRTPFMQGDAFLADFNQNSRYYSCSVIGIWIIVVVSATDPGESFHVTGGEITAASAGRIL